MFLEPNSIAAETGAVEYYLKDQATISGPPPPRREVRTFDTPKSIWITMFASYAIFFMGLMIATGRDGMTLMMIVISAGYAVIYFGTAIVMNNVDQAARPKQVPTSFSTHTGTIGYWAGFAQILTVPILIAAFSIAVAVIRRRCRAMNGSAPYRTTPVFDHDSLPAALRRSHSTKAGVWGRLCVLEGEVRYVIVDCGSQTVVSAGQAILILPEQAHFVEPLGDMRMCVEFYDHRPNVADDDPGTFKSTHAC